MPRSLYKLSCLAVSAAMLAGGGTAAAATAEPKGLASSLIDDAVVDAARVAFSNELVVMAIHRQNAAHVSLSQGDIDALDKRWREERKAARQPLVSAALSNPLSTYLSRLQAWSLGAYTEIFVMDRHGLNVGQSAITTDYWQGDEAKFQKTFPLGGDAVFIDDAEWHEDTKTWRAQLSMSITDPANGSTIGAVTVELNLTELQRRANAQ